jgi:hypothetical protein
MTVSPPAKKLRFATEQ